MNRASFYKRIQKPSVFNRRNRRGAAHRIGGTTPPTRKETAMGYWDNWIGVSNSEKKV